MSRRLKIRQNDMIFGSPLQLVEVAPSCGVSSSDQLNLLPERALEIITELIIIGGERKSLIITISVLVNKKVFQFPSGCICVVN